MAEEEKKTADELEVDPTVAEEVREGSEIGSEGEEEPLTAADIFPCADDEDEEICEPEPCPDCIPDPDHPIPNWKNRIAPFLNKKTCDYQVTIWTNFSLRDWSEVASGQTAADWVKTEDEMFEEWMANVRESARLPGLAKLLDHYSKDLNWPGPAPLCHPPGTTLVPGEDGWQALDEYGCDRLGGGSGISYDAEDDEEEAVPTSGKIYRDPNGELLDEAPKQGQTAEHWTDGMYMFDYAQYKLDKASDLHDGRDTRAPHGWISERDFFYYHDTKNHFRGEETDEMMAYLRRPEADRGNEDDQLLDGHDPIKNNKRANTFFSHWSDTYGFDTSYWRATPWGDSGKPNPVLRYSGVDHSKPSGDGATLEPWNEWNAVLRPHIKEGDNRLRFDPSGYMYIYNEEAAVEVPIMETVVNSEGESEEIQVGTQFIGPHFPITSPDGFTYDTTLGRTMYQEYQLFVYWMGDLQATKALATWDEAVYWGRKLGDERWGNWDGFAQYIIDSVKRNAGLDPAAPVLTVGSAESLLEDIEEMTAGPEKESDFSDSGAPPTPWGGDGAEYEDPDEQWMADVERSVTGQYLLNSEHLEVKKKWHQTGPDGRIKVKVAIPALIFNQIPEMAPGEPQPYSAIDRYEAETGDLVRLPYEVEFTTEDVADGMFTRMRWLLKHYAKKRLPLADEDDRTCVLETFKDTAVEAVDSIEEEDSQDDPELGPKGQAWNEYIAGLNDGPSPYTKVFTAEQLEKQADNIRDFSANLLDFLGENIEGWQLSYLFEHNKRTGIEKIKIEFTPRYQIKSVTYNLRGCPPKTLTGKAEFQRMYEKRVEELESETMLASGACKSENPYVHPEFEVAKGWGDFAYTYPQSDPRTMAYIASAPFMDDSAKATKPMEWQDFITLWTYPRVEIGNFNDLLDNGPPCNSVSDALEGILKSGFDVFMEVLLNKFDQQLCKTIEEGAEDAEDYWARYRRPGSLTGPAGPDGKPTWVPDPDPDRQGKDMQSPFVRDVAAATRAATMDVLMDDPMLKHIIENIEYIRDADGLWKTIFGQLSWCGLLNFLETLFACLFQGVDFGDILEQALLSALKKMDIGLFKRLLLGLPPWVQRQIAETASGGLSDNLKDWRPWDSEPSADKIIRTEQALKDAAEEYQLNKAQEQIKEEQAKAGKEAGLTEQQTVEAFAGTSSIDDEANSAQKQQAKQAAEEQVESVMQYQGMDDAKKTKTLGSMIVDSGAMQEIKDAYIEALMELLQPDEIIDMLENLPGFNFLRKLLDLTKCPGVTLFHPPLKGWFNDLSKALSEWEPGLLFWCTKPLYIPELLLNRPFLLWDMLKAIAQLLLEALEAAIVQALLMMLKMIIKWILELLCSMMGVLGAAALTAVGLMDPGEFRQMMKNSLCGSDASDADLQNALGAVMGAMGLSEAQTEEEVMMIGSVAEVAMGDFFQNMPVSDSLELLSGTPSTAAMIRAAEYFENSDASFADRMNAQTCKAVFGALGQTFMGPGAVDKLRDAYLEKMRCMNEAGEDTVPFCSLDAGRNNIMCAFENMGLNLPQSALDNMTDEALSELDDTIAMALDAAQSGGDVSKMPGFPDSLDPCFPTDPDSIIPREDEMSIAEAQQDAEGDLGVVQNIYENELIGYGGLFDRICSDKDGRGKRQHDKNLERLLRNHIAGNPKYVATYLRDILKGDRKNVKVSDVAAGDAEAYQDTQGAKTGTFKPWKFNLDGISDHALKGGWSVSWQNSLETIGGKHVYVWGYGRTWLDNYKSGSEVDRDMEDLDWGTETTAWDLWEAKYDVTGPGTAGAPMREFNRDKSIYRQYSIGPKTGQFYYYPDPHVKMEFLGTDPSMGEDSDEEIGRPQYHFHYWHEERHELEGSDDLLNNYLSAEEELTKDTAMMHIFEMVPGKKGGLSKRQRANSIGEYNTNHRSDNHGTFETQFRGFGPLAGASRYSSRSKGNLDPMIRVVRSLDDDPYNEGSIMDHLDTMNLDMANKPGDKQKPTVWATHIVGQIFKAAQESGVTGDLQSLISSDSNYSDVYDKLYGDDYKEITKAFLDQYAVQIAEDEDVWKSGLLNFELKQLTEDECLDVGLSKESKWWKKDSEEVALKRARKKRNMTEYPFKGSNDYGKGGTGWYRPSPAKGSKGLAENIDLPEDEYGTAAFYVHQQYQRGWARIADEYLPGPGNPCEEQQSADIFDWNSIKEHRSQAQTKIEDDERVSANPSCAWDPPFDRINTRASKAAMEGYIKATMRVAIHEKLILAMPAFKKFNASTGCYGDLLPAYMFKHMRQHLFDLSRKTTIWGSPGRLRKGHNRYDYKFLEQCCNMYVRGVKNGDITGSAEAFSAIEKIDEINSCNYKQPSVDFFHSKRKASRRLVWEKSEPYSSIIAQELFRIEFEKATKKFSDWSCAPVENLQRHFLSGSMNLETEDGPSRTTCALTDVATSVTDSPIGSDGSFNSEFSYLENGGFVLEKYIRIKDKDSEMPMNVLTRPNNLHEIVNMEAWESWLADQNNFKFTETVYDEESGEESEIQDSRKINEVFDSWSYGLRLSYVPSFHEDSSFKNMLKDVHSSVCQKHKAFKVGVPALTMDASSIKLIPIASTEIEIPGELRINDFNITDDYDFECLLDQFIKDAEFRALFEYVYPLDRLLSLPTIYSGHVFLHSIGLDDGWYQDVKPKKAKDGPGDPVDGWLDRFMRDMQHRSGPGLKTGDWLLFFRGLKKYKSYRNWTKVPFTDTREILRDLFEGEYDHDLKASGKWKLPSFKINFNLPPWGFNPPKWFANRRYEGPECDDGAGGPAETAAYNRG